MNLGLELGKWTLSMAFSKSNRVKVVFRILEMVYHYIHEKFMGIVSLSPINGSLNMKLYYENFIFNQGPDNQDGFC